MHIILIAISSLQKQMWILTIAKTVCWKSDDQDSFESKHSDIVITKLLHAASCAHLQQLEKCKPVVILPPFPLNVDLQSGKRNSFSKWCYLAMVVVTVPLLFSTMEWLIPKSRHHRHLFFFLCSLLAHCFTFTLSPPWTCWQQFVSGYQFSASSLRGREGCGNHLYLRLLGSIPPRHAGRHLPLSVCQAERVWDVGSSYTGHGHFFPKATEAKTLSGI